MPPSRKFASLLCAFFLFAMGCGEEGQKSGWLFVSTRVEGDETHSIRQYFAASKSELRNPDRVIPILTKFCKRLMSGDTLQIMAHTGNGESGSSRHLLEIKAIKGEFILVRGKNVHDGNKAISGAAIEAELRSLLEDGVQAMTDHEEFDQKWEEKQKKKLESKKSK